MKELDSGTKVTLVDGQEVTISTLLHTKPERLYAVRNRTGGVFQIAKERIHKVHQSKVASKKSSNKTSDVDVIKGTLRGDKESVKEFIRRFKRMPFINKSK